MPPSFPFAASADESLSVAERKELPSHFGFGPLEIFKIEHEISQLRTADFNNDGLNDIVVANNNKSTIEVLLQREAPPEEAAIPAETNDLVNHWRFERKPVSVVWRVDSLQAADVTGDGNVDLVFFGEPKELVVFSGNGDGTFEQSVNRGVRDGVSLPSCVDIGDLNADGRPDVALLAESDVIIYFQREEGGLGTGTRFSHALDNPAALKLADIDGDGRLDLILMTHEEEYPLRVRHQDRLGNLGPVQRMKLPGLRSVAFEQCLGRKAADLFGVERVSGRLKRWRFDAPADPDASEEWAVLYYPLPGRTDVEQLPIAVGDVNGDGHLDLVSADVDAAQMVLFLHGGKLGLLPGKSFGGQVKMRDMCCFDEDGDGADEVYVLSADEELIARSEYREHRLSFPKAIQTTGKPYAMDVGRLSTDSSSDAVIAYVAKTEDSGYELIVEPLHAAEGEAEKSRKIKIEEMDEPPSALRLVDVNRDGLNDVLIFMAYEPLITFLQRGAGDFAPLAGTGDTQKGLVKRARVEGFAYVDADGDGRKEVLLAQKAFVRALCVNDAGAWEILDQYNAPGADADVTGVAAYGASAGERPRLAMYDRLSREAHFFKPGEGGTYALDRSVQVGSFDLKAMFGAALAGGDEEAIVLADRRRAALVVPGSPAANAEEVGVYESSIKDGRLMQIAVGDLNHDERTDLAVIEIKDHFIEILTFGPKEELVRANKFRVFAKKQFQRMGGGEPEPRWVAIEDVTNDGFNDLLLIAHDRILLYPGQ